MVREREVAFVEIDYPKKVIFRAQGPISVDIGAHSVHFDGKVSAAGPFACLHLPLRARSELEKRAFDYEKRRAPFRTHEEVSWQSLYFKEALDRNERNAEWCANSYDGRGYLELRGRRTRTKVDFRLVTRLSRAYAYGRYLNVPMYRTGAISGCVR
jgi:hypothetical protein